MHMKITICSSASFYKHVIEIKNELEALGHTVFVPHNALQMHQNNDYDVGHYKTWFDNAGDYHKKSHLIRQHFDEIAKADVTLVVNDEKHGVANYIGGNVLMEMAIAFYLKQKIFLYGDVPEGSAFEEEIKGMMPISLQGDLTKISEKSSS